MGSQVIQTYQIALAGPRVCRFVFREHRLR